MVDVVGVSKAKTGGAFVTKSGRKSYRGQKRHWYVYFYDDSGTFKKKMITALEVPYYGSLIRRTKTYFCENCRARFRAMKPDCPKCGKRGIRLNKRGRKLLPVSQFPASHGVESYKWSYRGTFTIEIAKAGAPPSQP